MSEPISPDAGLKPAARDDQAVGPAERLHPFFLLSGLGGSLRGAAGGYALIGYLAVSGRAGIALLGVVALVAVLLVSTFIYWRRFEFRVGADEIRIDSGIFSRTHRSIPFDRVQDVDITQGPIARLLGVAQVKFETGGSASAGDDEGVLRAIRLDRAEHLRLQVRSGRVAGEAQRPAEEGEQAPVYAMDVRRLVLAGTFNFSLALFAGLFGLSQTFGDFAGIDPFSRAFWLALLSAGDPIAKFLISHQIATAIAGVALLLLVGLATGIVRTALREFGFRLDRVQSGLRRRRGLLTRTDVTLPVKRAQAILVQTGPLRDAFGWRELKLQSLAREEAGGGDHVLAPLADEKEIAAIISEIGWRPQPEGANWRRVSRAYVWTFAIALSPLFLIAIGQAAVWHRVTDEPGPLLFLPLAVVAAFGTAVFTRFLAWRRTAYALDGERLLVRTGWWRRRLLLLPLNRLQSIDIKDTLISRWFGISTLIFGVAGGRNFSIHMIPAVPRETARALRDDLLI